MSNLLKFKTVSKLLPTVLCRQTSTDCVPPLKGLVLGIFERDHTSLDDSPILTNHAVQFDEKNEGQLLKIVKEGGKIQGKLGECNTFHNLGNQFGAVSLVGLGRKDAGYNDIECLMENLENVRYGSALGFRALFEQGVEEIVMDSMGYSEQAAEGSMLASWKCQENKMESNRKCIPKLSLFDTAEIDGWNDGIFKAEVQNHARLLCDLPSNQVTPTDFAAAALEVLGPCGVKVEVRNLDWIEKHNMFGFLSIARSSCEPPLFMEITHCGGAPDEKPILLIGEGITFNTGGLCLRDTHKLQQGRSTMAGAACVLSTLRAMSALSVPINITALIPLCENMASGLATKPGDVIKFSNGKSIVITDTSKAGVLLLADTLLYGQQHYEPKLIIDVATLGDGMNKVVGGGATGIFTNCNDLFDQMKKAGALTGDRVWHMPLWDYYVKNISSCKTVDLSNKGCGKGHSCLAAAFLKNFIISAEWIHMDIRGVGMRSKNSNIPYLTNGRMTGRPTRTIIQFLLQRVNPDKYKTAC